MADELQTTLRVTALQTDIVWCDAVRNRRRIENLFEQAPAGDIYLLPEMFATGFCMRPEQPGVADSAADTLAWMQRWAVALNAAIAGSLPVLVDGGYRNRFFFVTPHRVETYDKRHLFGYGGEDKVYVPGCERVVVSFRGWRLLLQVCYDLRFPVFARNRGDYDAVLYVANWPASRIEVWDVLLRARALENQCYVVGANRVGDDSMCHYTGHAAIIDPYGRKISECDSEDEAVATAEINMERLAAFREKFPVLSDSDSFSIAGT